MEEKNTILVVDDTPENIDVLYGVLSEDYKIKVAPNGEKALKIAQGKNPPDLILLDIMMPGIDGYEVCERLKSDEKTRGIPILFVTAMSETEDETKGLEMGAVDYITKPISPPIVKARVQNHLSLKLHKDHLEDLVRKRTQELEMTQDVTILSLASLAETRDNETGGHIRRTQNYVRALALKVREQPKFAGFLTDNVIELLYKSAPLHDIGKVGVPDAILLKPGKLTEEEFEEMKKHSTYGREAILRAEESFEDRSTSAFLRHARDIAYTHHEKWAGSGYPQGIKGDEIPVSGRLMAVADVYDALICKRVYKAPFTHSKAVSIIEEGRGSHFDPDMIDAFLEIREEFRAIALELADHEEEKELLVQ